MIRRPDEGQFEAFEMDAQFNLTHGVYELIEIVGTVLGAFGGAAIVGGLAGKFVSDLAAKQWLQTHQGQLDTILETHKAELAMETDTHRLSLKRQELLFDREIQAADALIRLHRKIYPTYSHPDMDWHDACEEVATQLSLFESEAEEFLEHHSAIISDEVRASMEAIRNQAANAKFNVQEGARGVDPRAIRVGEDILEELNKARDQARQDLRR